MFYTIKEFARITGTKPDSISSAISRGKVKKSKNGKINADSLVNKLFLQTHNPHDLHIKNPIKELPPEIEKQVKQSEQRIKREPTKKASATAIVDIDYQIKLLTAQKLEKDVELKTIDIQKKRAKVIEVVTSKELMQRVVVILSSQYRQSSKQFLMELTAKYNIPDIDIASIQKKFDLSINKAVIEANDIIANDIIKLAEQLAGTLNVGESKT